MYQVWGMVLAALISLVDYRGGIHIISYTEEVYCGTTVFTTRGLAKCQMCSVYCMHGAQKFQKQLALHSTVIGSGLA